MKALIMLNKIWNWRLLLDYFQRWLFDTGTRSVELLSSLWLIGFALVFWFDDGAMNVLPTYYKFQAVPEPVLIATLLLLGGSQFWAMTQRSCRSDILGGFLLLVSRSLGINVTQLPPKGQDIEQWLYGLAAAPATEAEGEAAPSPLAGATPVLAAE